MKSNIITLAKFLTRYCGISHPNILNLTHEDVKVLFNQVKRSSFEFANNNPEKVLSGEIILVEDKFKHVIPYFAPVIDIHLEYVECKCVSDERIEMFLEEDLTALSNWELIERLRMCKKYCYYRHQLDKEMNRRKEQKRIGLEKRRKFELENREKEYYE